MAIIDALHTWAPRITTPEMTSELEEDMTKVSEGDDTRDEVVYHSRALLAAMMDGLVEHTEDLGEAISDAVTADAKVGVCPKCGRDLVVKNSAKTRSSFVGCMGWPDCDVTYPLPSNCKIEPLEGDEGVCPECGARGLRRSHSAARRMRCASIQLVLQIASLMLLLARARHAKRRDAKARLLHIRVSVQVNALFAALILKSVGRVIRCLHEENFTLQVKCAPIAEHLSSR